MEAIEALKQLSREVEEARKRVKMTGKQAFNLIVLQAKHNYTGWYGYCSSKKVIEVEGKEIEVELHKVGHNASHEFSVALLPDGRLITYSFCVNDPEDVIEFGLKPTEESVDIRGTAEEVDFPGYLGHY